jgi:hypothetical protein
MNWLGHILGLDSATGPFYLFWSGAGGVSIAVITGLLVLWHWFNCDERGCWRRGKYQLPDSELVVCLHHLRAGTVAREERREQEIDEDAVGSDPGKGETHTASKTKEN